jgi:hypothetical protein
MIRATSTQATAMPALAPVLRPFEGAEDSLAGLKGVDVILTGYPEKTEPSRPMSDDCDGCWLQPASRAVRTNIVSFCKMKAILNELLTV